MSESATIYVGLLDEGVDCWRPVRARHVGADLYRIADCIPDDEVWEFQPGQVVRCREHKFQNDHGLLAFEAVPLVPAHLEIIVASVPDREGLVAEIYSDREQVAEVRREPEAFEVDVYPKPNGQPWLIDLDHLLATLHEARQRLL